MAFNECSIQLVKLFNQNEIQWAFGGSSLLYYLGIPVEPRDLDVVVAKRDIEKAQQLLRETGATFIEEKISHDDFLTEKFYTFLWKGMEVDLMAVPGIKRDDATFFIEFDKKGVWKWVEEVGEKIPLCDPEDWLIYYAMMTHREIRVAQLEDYLKKNKGC